MRRVLITGAGGEIGYRLRKGLADEYELVLADRASQVSASRREKIFTGDLSDLAAVQAAMAGVDAVVHLAAHPDEGSFEQLLRDNIVVTHTVFEAMRRAGVARMLFASSNRVTGLYPSSVPVGPRSAVRPDGTYASTKVFGETLGRLYADRYGLEVACLRLGSFGERPRDVRQLSTWLSPRDCLQLFRRGLELPRLSFLVVYGVSANSRRWWSEEGWSTLGYEPEDNAEEFSADIDGPAPVIQGV
jgi:uronate dehydrogenase